MQCPNDLQLSIITIKTPDFLDLSTNHVSNNIAKYLFWEKYGQADLIFPFLCFPMPSLLRSVT